ncbi:MAG: hypothetical protein ACLSUW_08920 [Akkermansia sp.]
MKKSNATRPGPGSYPEIDSGKPELHERGRELFIHYYRKLHADLVPAPFL